MLLGAHSRPIGPKTGRIVNEIGSRLSIIPCHFKVQAYRTVVDKRTAPLPDFFIGAHAESEDLTLLTRDATRCRTCFSKVRLICP